MELDLNQQAIKELKKLDRKVLIDLLMQMIPQVINSTEVLKMVNDSLFISARGEKPGSDKFEVLAEAANQTSFWGSRGAKILEKEKDIIFKVAPPTEEYVTETIEYFKNIEKVFKAMEETESFKTESQEKH